MRTLCWMFIDSAVLCYAYALLCISCRMSFNVDESLDDVNSWIFLLSLQSLHDLYLCRKSKGRLTLRIGDCKIEIRIQPIRTK